MILDISGLKYINDILGYQLGDQLIVEIARELKTGLGRGNFICRYSENQFAAIIEGLNLDKYENIAQNIIRLFSSPFKVDRYELDVTINIGLSLCLADEQDFDALIDKANIALLLAKKEGKNTYKFYSPDINVQNYKEIELRHDLLKAIEREQLKVYYQPLVNLKTNEILATETLIRWKHPDLGMISPNEFMYLAEETGFIINIGDWILREVCRNYKHWLDNGLPDIKVSINFSSIQFFADNFVENIVNTINDFKLDPHFLIVEITESTLALRVNKAKSIMQKLHSFGIQVAIDNFGTGFSSLSYLNIFHIDILKIDASCIKDITLVETSAVITKNIINTARELKIKPVAEGIETWEQVSFLQELNCYIGQGYIYSKPGSHRGL
ncbi:MAG: putative bifunctional diguanylate cyclase/phosphodiesterase [Syntrophomonadaceae bacterium]|jgi:diguanylate cyclase (GGDEF)-like protein